MHSKYKSTRENDVKKQAVYVSLFLVQTWSFQGCSSWNIMRGKVAFIVLAHYTDWQQLFKAIANCISCSLYQHRHSYPRNSGRVVTVVRMWATNWEALVKAAWVRIPVAVSVVHLTMLNLLLCVSGGLCELGTTCRSLGMQCMSTEVG